MRKSGNKLKITCGVLSCAVLLSIFGFMFYAWYFGITGWKSKFETDLTEEQLIAIVTRRTEERYAEEIAGGATFTVELVYNFKKNKPEYFLVEIESPVDSLGADSDGSGVSLAVSRRILGMNTGRDDLYFAHNSGSVFWPDKSFYKEKGYENLKKYYGTYTSAVKKGRKMINLQTDKVIPWYRYEYLSRNGYAFPIHPY
jgi:hypothetical protein